MSFCFDSEPHFQYFGAFPKRLEGQGDIAPTMSLQGSCWMLTRKKYWELNICDESFGSWGSQGIEVAVKTWLSGGQVMCNKRTWYAHLFRTQGGDFGFPYHQSGNQVQKAKKHARDLFFKNKWEGQIYPLSWLVEKFWPVKGWTDEDLAELKAGEGEWNAPPQLKKGAVYYTTNRLKLKIARRCQRQLQATKIHIVSVSLKPMPNFGENIHIQEKPGHLTMFKQILAGLEASTADIIFLTEHDVIYHPSHFEFTPPKKDVFYYNTNVWKVREADGHAVRVDDCRQTSGLCAYRDLLIKHYKKRIEMVEKDGFSRKMGFEPGTHNRKERVDDYKSDRWESTFPNIDIRHEGNLTSTRWSKDQFRNKKYAEGWLEAEEVPGWGHVTI